MELGARLTALTNYVPRGVIAADIGTDHAYVPVYLVLNNICPKVIAGDNSSGPIESAMRTVEKYGLQDKIILRKGSGLKILTAGEAEVMIIAGMGGNSIRALLEDDLHIAESSYRLILQPMNNEGDLRLWLADHGWYIADESLVEDSGKIYVIIVAERGYEKERDRIVMEIGPRLIEKKDPLLEHYLHEIEKHYLKILNGLSKSRGREAGKKAAVYARKLAGIKEVKKWLQSCRPL